MTYTTLGTTDLRVSRICFGTWAYGGEWGSFDRETAVAAIRAARGLGITFFDTAQAYGFGRAEQLLGEALEDDIRRRRDEIVLATKGGLRPEGGPSARDASREWLRAGLEQSLEQLGTEYVDLYQVHWPDPNTPAEETAAALSDFVEEGKVRYVGVSNYGIEEMDAFRAHRKLDALQPVYHMFRRGIEERVLPYCLEHGIGVLVYGPLAHGLLSGKYGPDTKFPEDDWRSKSDVFRGEAYRRNLDVVERLRVFAEGRGFSLVQLAVAWTLARPGVDSAIVGARDAQQISETARAAEIDLSSDELEEIDGILASAHPVGGPTPEG